MSAEKGNTVQCDHLTIPYTLDELATFIGFDLPDEVMLGTFDRVVNQLYDTMQEQDRLREALAGLLADITEYQTINHLGGENNHWQVEARKALSNEVPDAG